MTTPDHTPPQSETDQQMAEADQANGEGSPEEDQAGSDAAVNTTEAKYGKDESPA